MSSVVRGRLAVAIPLLVILSFLLFLFMRHRSAPSPAAKPAGTASPPPASAQAAQTNSADFGPTNIYAHNLMLRKGPNFRIYVRWLRGQMTRAHRNEDPSFDDPDSFFLDVQTGVVRANIGDIGNMLNASLPANSPLKNIKLSAAGGQIKLSATVKKVIPLPIELTGAISALPGNRIQVHVTKLSLLKIPLKGLLGDFHVKLSDLFNAKGISGVQVSGNDIVFDTQQLLPPPHIRGQLIKVKVASPDLEEIYGNARQDVTRVEQWRNFLRLRDGTIDFGKLTMHHVDLIMIDISNHAWFDLDLIHYQEQLVNGYTRMTPQAGLQIFMPDLSDIPKNKANQNISVQWLKNRNAPPPADVTDNSK